MFDYSKLKNDFENKLFHEKYETIINIFKVYLENGNDCKELLECLKSASLEIREKQTLDSINKEANMLKDIFIYASQNKYLDADLDYVEGYIEDYRKMGNN